MTIKELRILPPFAIGRLGSASEPLDNYTIEDDPENPLGFRQVKWAPTLGIDEKTGKCHWKPRPDKFPQFKQNGQIRPVAPFLEVFAVTEKDELQPLSLGLLSRHQLSAAHVSWHVSVANRKVVRRTHKEEDLVAADTGWFSGHAPQPLKGYCKNFIRKNPSPFVDFGHVRFIKPSREFPEIRLRFTPAKGLIYGPAKPRDWYERNPGEPYPIPESRRVYHGKSWIGFRGDRVSFEDETVPPSLFAIWPPAPPWLNNNIAESLGYLDDACDGFVEVRLKLSARDTLTARARICAGPPAPVPDALFVRHLADDLDQVIYGPAVLPEAPGKHPSHLERVIYGPAAPPDGEQPGADTRERALDIVRRAYETVRFMNVTVMNGNNFKGRAALDLDSMPEEEAADTERAIRPVMAPGTVDALAIMALHAQVYAALQGGAVPWFVRLLRQPDEVADFTDRGRRKMPALMCGADNSYLALTHRQIDTLRKAAEGPPSAEKAPDRKPGPGKLTPRNLSAQRHYEVNYRAKGNPISSRPVTAVANCCPGLEVDFRAVWRRMFKGIVLREHDNLVVGDDRGVKTKGDLTRHRLLRVRLPNGESIPFTTPIKGPAPSDPEGAILQTTQANPYGLAALEWSNALARILSHYQGKKLKCDFTREVSEEHQQCIDEPRSKRNYVTLEFEVRHFFEADTAVISRELAKEGELTQGLCSPWQNDYRECSCYYWASARPDYVNVEPGLGGLSKGDNWLQKARTGDYVPDDYEDKRLILYDDLFREWEKCVRFQVGGRDYGPDAPEEDR